MTDDQLQLLIHDLTRRPPACEVRLGTNFAGGVAGTIAATAEQSRVRLDHISRGDRTVDVYRNGKIAEQVIAGREQVIRLERAGARPASVDVEAVELEAHAFETAGTPRP